MKKIIGMSLLACNLFVAHTYCDKTLEEVFTNIYQKHSWGGYPETFSGSGSTLKQTEKARILIGSILEELNITTMIDAPCGDFNWMKEIDLSGVTYQGFDIVKGLVQANQKSYGASNISFAQLDLCSQQLPKADLILCRDLFLHIKLNQIKQVLMNIKKSGSKYLLATSYKNATENKDIKEVSSLHRHINLELPPFNLPKPVVIISEDNVKWLGLWNIDEIPDQF